VRPRTCGRDRVEILDRQAAQQAEHTVVRDRAKRIADTIRIVDEAEGSRSNSRIPSSPSPRAGSSIS